MEKEYLQKLLDDVHEQFIVDVARGRHMLAHKVREVADGRVFTGEIAKNLGLVDKLGDLQDAIILPAAWAALKAKSKRFTPQKKSYPCFSLIFGNEPKNCWKRGWDQPSQFPAYLFAPGH